ncbi:TraB domain-containing protein [archaeon]|nr:TraB domain-containing protein [archaeon]
MEIHKNLTLLGTSHISIESVNEVKRYVTKNKPDIIAIELDKKRLYGITHKIKPGIKDIPDIGFRGFLINVIGAYIEKKLGQTVGVSPGSEMKMAIKLAKKYKLNLALIDQDINITLKRLVKAFNFGVIFKMIGELIKGLITRKSEIEPFDLKKVPPKKTIEKILTKVKEDYPGIHKVLIEDRNKVMAKNLYKLITHYPDKKIFAIVGAGHEKEILNLIKRN